MALRAANTKLAQLYRDLSETERVRLLARLAREYDRSELTRLREATPPAHAARYNHALRLLRVVNGAATDWALIFHISLERDRLRLELTVQASLQRALAQAGLRALDSALADPGADEVVSAHGDLQHVLRALAGGPDAGRTNHPDQVRTGHDDLAARALAAARAHAASRAQLEGLIAAIAIVQRDAFGGEEPLAAEGRAVLDAARTEAQRVDDVWATANQLPLRAALRVAQGLAPYPVDQIDAPAPQPTAAPCAEDMLQLIQACAEWA